MCIVKGGGVDCDRIYSKSCGVQRVVFRSYMYEVGSTDGWRLCFTVTLEVLLYTHTCSSHVAYAWCVLPGSSPHWLLTSPSRWSCHSGMHVGTVRILALQHWRKVRRV